MWWGWEKINKSKLWLLQMAAYPQSNPLMGHGHAHPHTRTHMQSYPLNGTHSYPLNGTHSYPFYVTHSELLSLWDTYGVTLSMGHTQSYPLYGTHKELPYLRLNHSSPVFVGLPVVGGTIAWRLFLLGEQVTRWCGCTIWEFFRFPGSIGW